MTKASHSKKSAKPVKKPAAKAAASKASPAKKAPVKAKPVVKAAAHKKIPAKPVAKASAKAEAHKKPAKVEKLTKAQLAAKAKEEKLKAKAASAKADPKKVEAAVMPQAKPGSKIAPKKPGENETPGDADSPLLDMSDVGVRKMIAKAKARGYVTYDELNKVLPSDKTSSEQIEDTMAMLNEMGINVIESEEAEEGRGRRSGCRRHRQGAGHHSEIRRAI